MYIEKGCSHQSASLPLVEYPSSRFANPDEGAVVSGGSLMITLASGKVSDFD